MGEAFIARGQTAAKNVLDDVNVVAGYCSILVKAMDSTGKVLPNIPVWCKDGARNYNYNTNAGGYVVFQCNSGAANITLQNFSLLDGYNIVDQSKIIGDYDAPVGTKKMIEMKLNSIEGNITIDKTIKAKFLSHNKINRVVTIGGGAAGLANCVGGGGGAYNETTNVALDSSIMYNIFIGSGGAGNNGQSGGTTTAFGISSIGGSKDKGGGSGSYRGGNGHNTTSGWNWQQYPSNNIISAYHKSNKSDPFKNYGHGGGYGIQSSYGSAYGTGPTWGGSYTSMIASGGGGWGVYDRYSKPVLFGSRGSAGPKYGCGGGGASGYGTGWVSWDSDDAEGGAVFHNQYCDGSAGSGAGGCVLINF